MQQPLITEIETVHATAITEIDIVHAVAITNAGLVVERLRVRIPASAAGEFSSPELTLCADSYLCPFHPVLPQWHVKDLGHSAKSAGSRLHPNAHAQPLTQQCRSGLTTPLSRHSLGTYPKTSSHANLSWNIRSQSFQLAEPLWTDPDIKSGISVCELISIKKKKSAGGH